MNNITTVAFDADDTLWANELFFRQGEDEFVSMLAGFGTPEEVIGKLYAQELQTLHLYGYGIKSWVISMVETAVDISGGRVDPSVIKRIVEIGRAQMERPVEVYEGVREVLEALSGKYRLVMATKGDLLDQWRKIGKSGLRDYFSHVEIMSDKKQNDYRRLLEGLGSQPGEFMMVGNSLKSDIAPVIELGGYAVHIPCDNTWLHETVADFDGRHPNFRLAERITDILDYI